MEVANLGPGQPIRVRSFGVLKPGGLLVSVVQQPPAEQCQAAKVRCSRPDRNIGPSVAALLDKVGELIAAGKYQVDVDQTFPLAQANQAWELGKHTRVASWSSRPDSELLVSLTEKAQLLATRCATREPSANGASDVVSEYDYSGWSRQH